MSKNGVTYKADLSAPQALAHLENLVASLQKGSVCVQVDKEYVVLGLDQAASVDVEISASQKKGKRRLSLELSWSDPKHQEEQAPSIVIGSQAPPMEPPRPAPPAESPAPAAKPAEPQKKAAPAPKKAAKKTATRKKDPTSKTK